MRDVVNAWVVFFGYAVLAVFAQNAIFTRALGVSRLVQLVGDDRTSSWLFGLQLCITQVLVAPLAWYAGSWIVPLENRAQLRPLAYVAAIAVVCTAEELVLGLEQHFFNLIQVGTIGHAKADDHSGDGVGERPVDQAFRHEGFVRDNDLFTIEVGNRCGTNTDLADRTGERTNGNRIANTYRTFKQNNQARDEVTEDFL